MKKEVYILLTKQSEEEKITGTIEEVIEKLHPIYKLKTDIYDNKQRKLEILGLPYLLFFKGSDIYVRIDIPQYNLYTRKLLTVKPESVYSGYRKISVLKLQTWQALAIDDIDYNGKEFTLWLLIFY